MCRFTPHSTEAKKPDTHSARVDKCVTWRLNSSPVHQQNGINPTHPATHTHTHTHPAQFILRGCIQKYEEEEEEKRSSDRWIARFRNTQQDPATAAKELKVKEREREISADCSSIPCACEESREKRRRNVIIIIYYVSPSLSQVFMYV